MEPELPQNRRCPACGASNLATATRCLGCNASLEPVHRPPDDILRIGGHDDPHKPPARAPFKPPHPSPWRPFLRFMGVVGIGVGAGLMRGAPDGIALGLGTFFALGILVLLVAARRDMASAQAHPLGESAGAVDVLDAALRGVGCLFSAIASLAVSVVGFFFVVCGGCR